MIEANETFEGSWPFQPRFFNGNGFAMHYVDEGDSSQTGDTIVCVHGEPTWGYLYRKFIPALSNHARVVVPDHMGFGKSATPQDRAYSIREHCDNLESLLLDLDLTNITLVIQDWGGAIGSSFALRHPNRVKRLCVCNTLVPGGQPDPNVPSIVEHPWFQWVQTEEFEPTITHLGATLLSVLKRIGFEHTAQVDENFVRAYASPFPSVAECRGALQFPRNIAAPETAEFFAELLGKDGALQAVTEKPAMYVHGEADRAIPKEFAVSAFKSLWPSAPVITLPGVGHFLQEDAPKTVVALIQQFIQMTR